MRLVDDLGAERECLRPRDAYKFVCAGFERSLERHGMIIVIPADERARALPLLFEENTAFAAGELPVVLQGYLLEYFGEFRGAGEAFLFRNGVSELTGERPGARHEARDVAERGARIADEGERRFVIFPRLTGEACDDVRAEGDSRNALLECAREPAVIFRGMPAAHQGEHAVASALHGQVNEFVQAVVLICFEERVEISENMPRVAHSDAYPVIARDARKNFLQQFREVRAGVESVAARVLPGEAFGTVGKSIRDYQAHHLSLLPPH